MNRKEFLQVIGGAAASAAAMSVPAVGMASSPAATGSTAGGPAAAHKLTRGVSFYSYQAAYYSGTMSVEECVAEAGAIGATGLEIIADAMIPDFPTPSTKWVDDWWDWMEKYHTVPVNYCGSHDTMILGYRPLTTAEGVERMTRDIHCAHRLGFTQLRLLGATPLDVVEKCLPIAEKNNVSLNFEIHGPNPLKGRLVETWVKFFEKVKSKYIGLNPDMSLFEKRPQALGRDQQIRVGRLKAEIAKYIDKACADAVPMATAEAEVKRMGGGPREIAYFERRYGGYQDPKLLLPLKQYCHHMHAKLYGVTEDFQEICIAYEEVLPFLIQNGFEMCLTTEYEGQRFIMDAEQEDEVEQVRRHHVIMKKYLGI
jgi:sugar phosphate isomerase/epimerase